MPKCVVSTTITETDPGWQPTTILRSIDDVARLKEQGGAPIIVNGSATLAQNLAAAGLVDRYHLLVFPVVLGAGKRLFTDGPDTGPSRLDLVEHAGYANGHILAVYNVRHQGRAGPDTTYGGEMFSTAAGDITAGRSRCAATGEEPRPKQPWPLRGYQERQWLVPRPILLRTQGPTSDAFIQASEPGVIGACMTNEPTPFEVHESRALFHGTKADLEVGDLLEPGRNSNFGGGRTGRCQAG